MMMLKSLGRLSQSNFRQVYLKTSLIKQFSSVGNELAKPQPKTPSSNDGDDEISIATALFDNSSITHSPGKPDKKFPPPKPKGNDYLSLKSNFIKETEKRQVVNKTKPQAKDKEQIHGRVLYDRNMDMEIIRLERQQDPLVTSLLTKVRSRKRRDKDSEILIEGHRLIREALDCGLHMNALLFSQTHQLKHIYQAVGDAQRKFNTKIYKVGQHDIKTWSTLVTPPGLMAIFQRPPDTGLPPPALLAAQNEQPLPVTVICDNIREPNNLGSIIRTCAALPCHQVIVTRGCCDPWESKALRGGCGGQFRVRIHDDCDWADLAPLMNELSASKLCVYVAESNVSKAPDQTATIEYTNIEMLGDHCVVVIGGESHGISQEAYDFLAAAGKELGKCVHIPLANGVESLNVTSALTLILYELRRNLAPPKN